MKRLCPDILPPAARGDSSLLSNIKSSPSPLDSRLAKIYLAQQDRDRPCERISRWRYPFPAQLWTALPLAKFLGCISKTAWK